ncbi:arsenate reductase/protein-tyrosine-phosphatase family protein [Pseudoprimorskyibacter insulae]|uniref:Glutaredoxin arsenate reductase n=1 Tax=Pseudoprimorskyibacter insulae TaxID=1695997 RepID=A0A2R8ARN9_9RHOB|nr:helix-turn-helix domain-containing protein [Pseudoprimorskyibacter insulae]SPF78509.1 Glutaredoxin arsenate reductase [Pseudoprimorskyibacter insulae]
MDAHLTKLSTLAHEGRMSVFRLLVRRYPDAVAAGQLAAALGIKPSTLSMHLSALASAGLIEAQRSGTSRLYRMDMAGSEDLARYMFADCWKGRPLLGPAKPAQTHWNVLFLCTGNSARSLMAEALLRDLGRGRFSAYSAGTHPFGQPNPRTIALLQGKGHDTSFLASKQSTLFQGPDAPHMDFVFTVCDQAANEDCPAWDGQPISAHWGLPDPVKATGSDAEISLVFQRTYGVLRNRIAAFAALPIETLDRISLQAAVDDLAHMGKGDMT